MKPKRAPDTAPAALDDAELVRRACARDDGAFRTIMQRHNRRLYRIVRSIVRNDHEAEDVSAKRVQIQERLTAQIANTINDVLQPRGVAVVIKASHHCMTTRGVHKPDTDLVTSRMLGCFRDDAQMRQEFLGTTV